MNRSRRLFSPTLAVLVICGLALLCCRERAELSSDQKADAVKRGGVLKVALVARPDTLDPHHTSTLGSIQVHSNIYSGLLKLALRDGRLAFVPDLAESWDQESPTVHRFRLRSGVTFHDGTPVTAQAVKASLERVRDPKEASPHAWKLDLLERIEIVDDLTLRLHFRQPYPFFRVAMTGSTGRAGTIVSISAVKKFGSEFGVHPVGTGPFRFVEWIKNDRIVLERNSGYFEKGEDGRPLPYLDRVELLLVEEPTTAITALRAGEIDGMGGIPFQFVDSLRQDPNLQIFETVGGNWTHLTMNTRRPPFDDKNFRCAVAATVDRNALVQRVYYGGAIPAHGPISPPMADFYDPAYESGKNGQYFDLGRARELLRASRHPTGGRIRLLVRGEEEFPQVAQVVQAQLKQIGLDVTIEVADVPAFNQKWDKGDFDIAAWHWVADLDPDETLFPELHTGEKWNTGGWSNARFDAAVEAAQRTTDIQARRDLYRNAQDIIAEECPVAVLVHKKEFKVFRKDVRGFEQIPADLIDLHRVWLDR